MIRLFRPTSMIRLFMVVILSLAVTAPLAACGKKGPPKLPPGQTDDYPRKYPK